MALGLSRQARSSPLARGFESKIVLAAVFLNGACLLIGQEPQSNLAANVQPPARRVSAAIDESQIVLLTNNTDPAVARHLAVDRGEASASARMPRMSIHFSLAAAQQASLDQLLVAQQNRRSPQYRKFLTPEEYAARFGLVSADIDSVTRWLESLGFSNIEPARARTSIRFSGTVAQARSAFHTHIHRYTIAGETYFANTGDPAIPKALENVAIRIGGLSNFLAVIGQSDIAMSDLRAFRSAANLPPRDPIVVIPTGDVDPGIRPTDEQESDLDLEWAGAIAKNANLAAPRVIKDPIFTKPRMVSQCHSWPRLLT